MNISLLKLALQCLTLLPLAIHLFISLFTNHTNNIILADNNLSPSYEVLQGIDQGEVISPLLWIIYYDPMFAKINSLVDSFEISLHLHTFIYTKDTVLTTYSLNVIGYLDDTI